MESIQSYGLTTLASDDKTCLAKSTNISLHQHIKDLYKQFKLLTFHYPNLSEREIRILLASIYYHDAGKISKDFQKMVKKKIKKDTIPHHYLSLLLFCAHEQANNPEDYCITAYAILNHHKRGRSTFFTSDKKLLKTYFTDEKLKKILPASVLNLDLLPEILTKYCKVVSMIDSNMQKDFSNQFTLDTVKLSGLLIRVDHSASQEAKVIEEAPVLKDRVSLFKAVEKTNELREFQSKYKDKDSIAVVADTGMGKTGLAFMWAKRKMFYVLPNRASANAMYEKFKAYAGEDKVGLLHSNSLFYLAKSLDNQEIEDDLFREHELTRALSKPITITTADQLFTAAFKYPTYEKIYATLSYSDIVIDEIQAFDPYQIVPMLRQIQETMKLGARYLIITATLPSIVKEELQKIGIEIVDDAEATKDNTLRHKIQLVDQNIEELVKSKLEDYKHKKVLIIVNNVSTAQELYNSLKDKCSAKLLHARFTLHDKQQKEEEIKKDFKSNAPVVWIATQIVEASLDIDFDVLFTELATVDSLVQRMGRIYRHRKEDYNAKEPNIYIACSYDANKVHKVYEPFFLNKTKELLAPYNNQFLTSDVKRNLVSELYDKNKMDKRIEYFKKWEKTEALLNIGLYNSKQDAQQYFRDVITVEVIHQKHYETVKNLIKQYTKCKDKKRKFSLSKEIDSMKIQVPFYMVRGKIEESRSFNFIVLSEEYFDYDSEQGLKKRKMKK